MSHTHHLFNCWVLTKDAGPGPGPSATATWWSLSNKHSCRNTQEQTNQHKVKPYVNKKKKKKSSFILSQSPITSNLDPACRWQRDKLCTRQSWSAKVSLNTCMWTSAGLFERGVRRWGGRGSAQSDSSSSPVASYADGVSAGPQTINTNVKLADRNLL